MIHKGYAARQRIRDAATFREVYSEQRRLFGRYFVLYYRENNLGYARLGTVASKRSIRRAVVRNRVKRLAREAFREHQHELTGDIVINARFLAASASKRELHQCLERLFSQLRGHGQSSLT